MVCHCIWLVCRNFVSYAVFHMDAQAANSEGHWISICWAILYTCLVIVFPKCGGGTPWAVRGGIGDFVGILQHICALVVGQMKGL